MRRQQEGDVGTWGAGPFDNDTAADWCNDLDDATPERRPELIRQALAAVVGNDGYLDSDLACEAIAAAAIVASIRPSGAPIESGYGPEFLIEGETLSLPAGIDALAIEALDRIVGPDSEWRDLWEEAGDDAAEPMAALEAIRRVLEQSA